MRPAILCRDCKRPTALFDYVVDGKDAVPNNVVELCELCLGARLVDLVKNNLRFLVTAWSRESDGYTKVIVEGGV